MPLLAAPTLTLLHGAVPVPRDGPGWTLGQGPRGIEQDVTEGLTSQAEVLSPPAVALVRLTQTESRHHSCHRAQQYLPPAIILRQGN